MISFVSLTGHPTQPAWVLVTGFSYPSSLSLRRSPEAKYESNGRAKKEQRIKKAGRLTNFVRAYWLILLRLPIYSDTRYVFSSSSYGIQP